MPGKSEERDDEKGAITSDDAEPPCDCMYWSFLRCRREGGGVDDDDGDDADPPATVVVAFTGTVISVPEDPNSDELELNGENPLLPPLPLPPWINDGLLPPPLIICSRLPPW